MIVFLLGFMGAGKSYLGRQLAEASKADFIDLDDLLAAKMGMSINQIFEEKGEIFFRDLESQTLKEVTAAFISNDLKVGEAVSEKLHFISCGGGTPCYNNNMDWMNKHGKTVWLNPPKTVLFERLQSERSHRPLLKDLDDSQLMDFIEKKLAERDFFYDLSKLKIKETDFSVATILNSIINA